MSLKIDQNSNWVWVIAYIDRDFIDGVEKDLSYFQEYKGIEAYIPTVKILKKQFKGKNIFETVPLLFNYGFFKIPLKSCNIEFFSKMREDIPCIHAWVKDLKPIISIKPNLRPHDEGYQRNDVLPVAVATNGEIARLVDAHAKLSIYSKEDMENLKEGTLITLKGYPFDGMPAKVISVNIKTKQVKVELLLEALIKEIMVSFDNVFYTIYAGGYDEDAFREQSLEELAMRGKNNVDRLFNSMEE